MDGQLAVSMDRATPQGPPSAEVQPRRPRVVAVDDSGMQRVWYQHAVLPVCADASASCVLGATWEESQRVVQVVLGRMAPNGTDADMAPADVVILDQVPPRAWHAACGCQHASPA